MRHPEFYVKYRTNYPPLVNPLFTKRNWWRILLITLAAVLIEPLIMYKNLRSVPFSFEYYLQLIEYVSLIAVPFVAFLLWVNWRELIKRKRGYVWVGKFVVVDKQSSLGFFYFYLAPGYHHHIKVNRRLYEKTSLGDFIRVRRDALGTIEEVSKINNVSGRLSKVGGKRSKLNEPRSL